MPGVSLLMEYRRARGLRRREERVNEDEEDAKIFGFGGSVRYGHDSAGSSDHKCDRR